MQSDSLASASELPELQTNFSTTPEMTQSIYIQTSTTKENETLISIGIITSEGTISKTYSFKSTSTFVSNTMNPINGDNNIGIIIGAVIGSVSGIVLISAASYYIFKYLNKNKIVHPSTNDILINMK